MGSGFGFTIGTLTKTVDSDTTRTYASASTIGSTEGNVNLTAGRNYTQTGSHVVAPEGDINISAKKVDINEARESYYNVYKQSIKKSGLTVSVSAPALTLIDTADNMLHAAKTAGDPRMTALALGTSALSAKNALDATQSALAQQNGDFKNPGISVSITAGTSKSSSKQTTDTSLAAGSTVAAGGNVNITATGAGKDSSLTIRGSDVTAGHDVNLKSDGDVNLLAAANISDMERSSKSSNASAGVSITYGKDGFAAGITVSAGVGRGKGEGTDVTWNNTHVVAGKSKINSDFASVVEQSGIKAGDDGFKVNVKGNTDLQGAIIASTDKAVADGKNSLTTGTLTTSDIKNHAEYDAKSVSVSGGYTSEGFRRFGEEPTTPGTPTGGIEQTSKDQTPTPAHTGDGQSQPTYNGWSAGPPSAVTASDEASSTTKSGISGATVTITDEAKQKELTGKDADTTIASLNRDVSSDKDTTNALKPIFDEDKIKAKMEIAQAFGREVNQFLVNRAKEADALKEALKNPNLSPEARRDLENKLNQLNAEWGPGGTYRQIATSLLVAASGNVSNSSGQFIQNGAVAYLQQLGAQGVKKIADALDSESARAALHAVVGCAGAAASNQNCGTGAMSAAGSSVINSLLNTLQKNSELNPSEREARINLVNSFITGISALTGADPATASNTARIETENNSAVLRWFLSNMPLIPGKPVDQNANNGDPAIPPTQAGQSSNAPMVNIPEGIKEFIQQIYAGGEQVVADVKSYIYAHPSVCVVNPPLCAGLMIFNSGNGGKVSIFTGITGVPTVSENDKKIPRTNIVSVPNGTWEQANGDFDKMNLANVETKQTKLGELRIGYMADGTAVIVRSFSSDGRPTIELQDSKGNKFEEVRYGNK